MPRKNADRCHTRAICQITEDEPTPCYIAGDGNWEDIIRKLLPTPALPPQPAVPILSDREVLIQQLMGALCPPTLVAWERSPVTDLETMFRGHGGGYCFAGPVSRFRRGVFFVRGVDPYDGPMQDS